MQNINNDFHKISSDPNNGKQTNDSSGPDRISLQISATKFQIKLGQLLKAFKHLQEKNEKQTCEKSKNCFEKKEFADQEESDEIHQNQNQQAENLLSQTKNKLKEREMELQKIQSDKESLTAELSSWKKISEDKASLVLSMTSQNQSYKTQIDQLKRSLEEERQSRQGLLNLIQTLKSTQDEIQHGYGNISMYMKEIEGKVNDVDQESSNLSNIITKQNSALLNVSSNLEKISRENRELEKEAAELKLKITELTGIVETKTKDAEQSVSECNIEKASVQDLTTQVARQLDCIKAFEKEKQTMKTHSSTLESTIQSLKARILELESENTKSDQKYIERNNTLCSRTDELELEIQNMKSSIEDKEAQIKALGETNATLMTEFENATKEKSSFELKCKHLEENIKELQANTLYVNSKFVDEADSQKEKDNSEASWQDQSDNRLKKRSRKFVPGQMNAENSDSQGLKRKQDADDPRNNQTNIGNLRKDTSSQNSVFDYDAPFSPPARRTQQRAKNSNSAQRKAQRQKVYSAPDESDVATQNCPSCGDEPFGLMLQCSECSEHFHSHCTTKSDCNFDAMIKFICEDCRKK